MPNRRVVLERLVSQLCDSSCVVSALGYITRDIYALTPSRREQCFYCMGSMGSVVPLAMGIALACPNVTVFALEGDGSLLMNLGSLITVRRYAPPNLVLIVLDNRCYESTGGQPSQPDGFHLHDVIRATGLPITVVNEMSQFDEFLLHKEVMRTGPSVVVVDITPSLPSLRVDESPPTIARRFIQWVNNSAPSTSKPFATEENVAQHGVKW